MTREYITKACPAATGFLDIDFDPALLGWVDRYDLVPPRVAYALEQLIPIAAGRWEDDILVEWINTQYTKDPECILIERVPDKTTFWDMVKSGMLVWDRLTPAVCGVTQFKGESVSVYHHQRALQDLADAIASSDDEPGIRLFFEESIQQARLGPRTPMVLYSDQDPKNNRLGFAPPEKVIHD